MRTAASRRSQPRNSGCSRASASAVGADSALALTARAARPRRPCRGLLSGRRSTFSRTARRRHAARCRRGNRRRHPGRRFASGLVHATRPSNTNSITTARISGQQLGGRCQGRGQVGPEAGQASAAALPAPAATPMKARRVTSICHAASRRRVSKTQSPCRRGNRAYVNPCTSHIVRRYDRAVRRQSRRGLDYATLADWRYLLRRLIGRRELAAREAGVEPQQYMLLLQIKGLEKRGRVTVGMLAERLQIRHHSAVELVDRLVERGMVARRRHDGDRRRVVVVLRPKGDAVLRRLVLYSLAELRTEAPALLVTLGRLVRDATDGRRSTTTLRRTRP